MKKNRILFGVVAMLTVFAMTMAGCDDGGSSGTTTHKVTFNANAPADATATVSGMPATIDKQEDQKPIGAKSNPTLAGYTFDGWYQNAAGTGNAWVLATDPVTSELNLYAKWTKQDGPGPGPGPGPISGNLGDITVENNESQKGWATNGTDNIETDLDIADLIDAQFLVLTLSQAPAGGIQIIWQGDGDGWGWNQEVIADNTGVPDAAKGASLEDNGDGTFNLKIELSKALANYAALKDSTKAKIFIAYYSPDFDALGVIGADLIAGSGTTTVRVTFDADGGTPTPPAQNVAPGEKATEPTGVTKTGNSLEGWYNGATKWNFATDTVTADITLKAKWTAVSGGPYTVTFDANGGTPTPDPQTVAAGEKATEPTGVSKGTDTLNGWYNGTTKWNFATDTVTANITLTANWTPEGGPGPEPTTYTVTFNADGGTPAPAVQTVASGGKATEPTGVSKGTDTLEGWYNGTTKWNFATDTVTADITLTANWIPEGGPGPEPTTKIKVNTTDVYVDVGAVKGTVAVLPEGFTFTYPADGANIDYGNSYAFFKVDFGADTLGDYKEVNFTFNGVAGDVVPTKDILLYTYENQPSGWLSGSPIGTLSFSNASMTDFTFAIKDGTLDNKSELYFVIIFWAAENRGGVTTSYTISDIEFIKGARPVETYVPQLTKAGFKLMENGGTNQWGVDSNDFTMAEAYDAKYLILEVNPSNVDGLGGVQIATNASTTGWRQANVSPGWTNWWVTQDASALVYIVIEINTIPDDAAGPLWDCFKDENLGTYNQIKINATGGTTVKAAYFVASSVGNLTKPSSEFIDITNGWAASDVPEGH